MLTSYNKARAAIEMPVDNKGWPDLLIQHRRLWMLCFGLIGDACVPWLLYFVLVSLAVMSHFTAIQRFLRARRMLVQLDRRQDRSFDRENHVTLTSRTRAIRWIAVTDSTRPNLRFLLSRPQHMLALSLGAGLSPVAPGTVGSLLGFGLHWCLLGFPPVERVLLYLLLFTLGAWCCTVTGKALNKQDHRSIVWDETVGMSLVLEFVPTSSLSWIAGFVLFRIFDVVKPWPVNLAHEAEPSGFFVMLDDVLAAAYAIIILLLLAELSACIEHSCKLYGSI
jgi:phosphatidylglycerophosphatase A